MFLYLLIRDMAMSLVLVQEWEGNQQTIYYVSNVFKGKELRYHKIERLMLVVVITSMTHTYRENELPDSLGIKETGTGHEDGLVVCQSIKI